MKNFLLIIIILIFITISIILFNNKKINIETSIINNYAIYPFYKKELHEEYIKYQNNCHLSDKESILHVNIGLNKPFYTDSRKAKNLNSTIILVNKYNYLEKDYVPNNLVILDEFSKPGIRLNSEAYEKFKEMANDALKEDDLKLRIVSAYRSYEYQENLYNNYLKYDDRKKVDTYSARAGYSEHQTGLAVDIDNEIINYNRFHITREFAWISKNAHKYGFILRYPLGKEYITGYKYEPWHYRYVGKDIATYIYQNNITYEEYYYEFIDK